MDAPSHPEEAKTIVRVPSVFQQCSQPLPSHKQYIELSLLTFVRSSSGSLYNSRRFSMRNTDTVSFFIHSRVITNSTHENGGSTARVDD